jgi:hypothetical protein
METNSMPKIKSPASFGRLYFSTLLMVALLVSMDSAKGLCAQAPVAGASVVVRMIEPVNSASDPAGKQYRASVTKAVDAGNGVNIPQGAVAAVTLSNNGSGWTTQLVSVTINGQPVSVASGPASVTTGVQGAASSAMSSVNSMLGAFGHHASAPAGAAAVAMGQRVVLPPGTTLTFVLSQPPAASGEPAAPAGQSMTASASSAPSPAAASGSGQMDSYRCYLRGQKITHNLTAPADNQIVYVTPIFHGAQSARFSIIQAFGDYMRSAYDLSKVEAPTTGCDSEVQANVPASQEKQWAASKIEVINVNWTGSPAELAATTATAAASAPAASAGGPFISCSTRGTPGMDIYVTGIFQTTLPIKHLPNGAKFVDQSVLDHFHAYLTQQGYKFTPGSNGGCDVSPTEAAAETAQHTRIHGGNGSCGYCGFKVVETGWKNTP